MLGELIAKVLYWLCFTLIAQRTRPYQIIGKKDKPYLLRWSLLGVNKKGKPRRPFGFTVYLHCFVRSDHDVHHDHPWNWWSFILKGGYREHTKGDYWEAFYLDPRPAFITDNRVNFGDDFDLAFDRFEGEWREGKAEDPHWVELYPADKPIRLDLPLLTAQERQDIRLLPPSEPCWTLFIMGRWKRDWGFHTPHGWRFWRDYLRAGGEANGGF